MIIHSFRPHLAELLNIISYTYHKNMSHDTVSNHDLLFSVLYKVSQALELQITSARMRQIIVDSQNQGMFYAVRSKPESLLYYPVFKMILQEGLKAGEFSGGSSSAILTYLWMISKRRGLGS